MPSTPPKFVPRWSWVVLCVLWEVVLFSLEVSFVGACMIAWMAVAAWGVVRSAVPPIPKWGGE